MKKIALLLLLAASFSMPAFAADGAEPIKLISYNLRTSHGKDGDNVWMKRRHATPEMIRREAPDVFGVQEGLIDQLHYIDTECPQYARVGVGRDDGAEKGEFMAVYYLRDRFELLDSGTFWLSETPDKVSRGWDGACNRTVTWVELRDKTSGKSFFYFNTHLDHQGRQAREEGIKLLVEIVGKVAGKAPAILGGRERQRGDVQRFRNGSRHDCHRPHLLPRQTPLPAVQNPQGRLRRPLHFGPLPHRNGLHAVGTPPQQSQEPRAPVVRPGLSL